LGHAYNLGLEACPTEYALLMDSDCIFVPGTIEKLRRGLDAAVLSKGAVQFSHGRGVVSRAIAAYRTFHTSDHLSAFSPPLALSRSAVKLLLGGYFDEALAWAEDLDFDRRVKARGIRIAHLPEASVVHPPLTLSQDLRAAFRYGTGYAVGERKGIFPSPRNRTWRERLDADLWHFKVVLSAKGTAAALYAMIWAQAYRLGFWSERRG
jgi:GT2 family glycosyltransferase